MLTLTRQVQQKCQGGSLERVLWDRTVPAYCLHLTRRIEVHEESLEASNDATSHAKHRARCYTRITVEYSAPRSRNRSMGSLQTLSVKPQTQHFARAFFVSSTISSFA